MVTLAKEIQCRLYLLTKDFITNAFQILQEMYFNLKNHSLFIRNAHLTGRVVVVVIADLLHLATPLAH